MTRQMPALRFQISNATATDVALCFFRVTSGRRMRSGLRCVLTLVDDTVREPGQPVVEGCVDCTEYDVPVFEY